MNRTRVVAYLRVSTANQAEDGVSLAAQESKVRAYCECFDLDLVSVEVDAGESAKSLRRPALQRALASLKCGSADSLLVVKLDRLTRSIRDLCHLVDEYFSDGKHGLKSISESIDTTSAAGRMVLNLIVCVGQWEREAAGERTSAAKAHLATQGKYLGGGVPFGYRQDGANVVEDADEQAVITSARALREQGLSMRAIAATLDERGMRARAGRIGVGHVQRMLAA